MRKELARRTRHQFEEQMARRLPWFERVRKAPYKGTLLFRWELVADALDRLLDEGMSYLRTVAARRGRELPAELGE
jgi:hypothetical protein